MPFAMRGADGALLSLHRDPLPGAEALPSDHPEVLGFLGTTEQHRFATLDAGLVRVLEDLVDALITRNVLCITDLPPEAQQKLFDRRHFRERVGRNALQLFDTSVDDAGMPGASASRHG